MKSNRERYINLGKIEVDTFELEVDFKHGKSGGRNKEGEVNKDSNIRTEETSAHFTYTLSAFTPTLLCPVLLLSIASTSSLHDLRGLLPNVLRYSVTFLSNFFVLFFY